MKRRNLLAVATAMALTATTAACGSSGPGTESGGPTKVQVWALEDAAVNPIATASIKDFNTASGNNVELTTYVNDAYKQKLQVSMGSPQAPTSSSTGAAATCPSSSRPARSSRSTT